MQRNICSCPENKWGRQRSEERRKKEKECVWASKMRLQAVRLPIAVRCKTLGVDFEAGGREH